MAETQNEEFLDDIEQAEAEEHAEETAEITDSEAELDALRAERDALQDKFMRALADAETRASGPRKTGSRPKITAAQGSPATCCRSTTT